jgi:integrase
MVEKLNGDRWFVRVLIRVNGKPVKRQRIITGTREQARKLFEDLKTEIRADRSLKLQKHSTFREILQRHIDSKNLKSPSYQSRYRVLLKDLGDISLNVFPDKFEQYLKVLRRSISRNGKPYANASINRFIEIVKAAFNLCADTGLIESNIFNSKRFPKQKERARDRYLTVEERTRLFNAIEQHAPYLRPIVQYSLLVPCRKGELTGLGRDAYNSFTNTLYIPDSKAGIPINKPVPESMRAYFQNIPSECQYLFYRQDSTGFHSLGDFKRAWHTCLKIAGLKNVFFHDTRHVAASDLYADGISERKIMDIAGWKTSMLTTYRHKDSLKSAQDINAFFQKKEGKCIPSRIPLQASNG